MTRLPALLLSSLFVLASIAWLSGCGSDAYSQTRPAPVQAPALAGAQPVAATDRVYTADQTLNTISVINPATNTVLGTIALGNARPDDLLGALYNKQINTHGLGFSPDGKLLAAVNVTTNSVSVIDTASNAVRGTVYLRRAPHEAFFTADGKEIWVAVRGEGYVAVIDVATLKETMQIQTTDGAAMVIFRPDGAVAFVNSSRTAELTVVDVKTHAVVKRITGLVSPFSPNLAASPDGKEVWLTHKDVGKTTIVDAQTTVLTVPAAAADGPAAHRHGSVPALPPAPFVASSAKPFAGLMDDAMSVMNAGMGSAPMTGDADHDFAGMMIPHHQGAVDMAKAQLLYGKNPVLRRLAQEIIVTQGSEIAVMRAELARGKDVRTARPADFSKP